MGGAEFGTIMSNLDSFGAQGQRKETQVKMRTKKGQRHVIMAGKEKEREREQG